MLRGVDRCIEPMIRLLEPRCVARPGVIAVREPLLEDLIAAKLLLPHRDREILPVFGLVETDVGSGLADPRRSAASSPRGQLVPASPSPTVRTEPGLRVAPAVAHPGLHCRQKPAASFGLRAAPHTLTAWHPTTGGPNAGQDRKERRGLDRNPLPPRDPKRHGSCERRLPPQGIPRLRCPRIRPRGRILGRRRRLLLRLGPQARRGPLGGRSARPVRVPRRRRASHGRHGAEPTGTLQAGDCRRGRPRRWPEAWSSPCGRTSG